MARHKIKITIDKELRQLIAPLRDEERAQLENNILRDGCREPLAIWRTNGKSILLDGHNRYQICKKHGLTFETVPVNIGGHEEARLWVLGAQAGRRNLTDDQRAMIWAEILEQRAKFARAKQLARARAAKKGAAVPAKTTGTMKKRDQRYEVAKEGKVTVNQLRVARKLRKLRPALARQVLDGTITLRQATAKLKAPAPASDAVSADKNLLPYFKLAKQRKRELEDLFANKSYDATTVTIGANAYKVRLLLSLTYGQAKKLAETAPVARFPEVDSDSLLADIDSECPKCHFLWKRDNLDKPETCPLCKRIWKPEEILTPDFERALDPKWDVWPS